MAEIFDVIRNQLRVSFGHSAVDNLPYLLQESDWTERATTMPPGPVCTNYALKLNWKGDMLESRTKVEWHPLFLRVHKMGKIPNWQLTHRSRQPVVSCSYLRRFEIQKRIKQVAEWKSDYEKFALSDRESEELFNLVLEVTLKHLAVNHEWILHYVNDHLTSSLGREHRHGMSRAHKWREALTLSPSQWAELYDITKGIIEDMYAHPGDYSNIRFWFGMRGRVGGVEGSQMNPGTFNTIRNSYLDEISRTRIVMFFLALSIWTAFIPNKVGWYREIMEKAMDMLGVHAEIHIPFLEGGKIYGAAARNFQDNGDSFEAYDGKSWESGVAIILGKAFRPFMINLGNMYMLPSGISVTSLLNTLANIVYIRNADGIYVILGDDNNHWKAKHFPHAPFMEKQPEDTKYRYILGLSFAYDPFLAVICGAKISMDRAGVMRPARIDNEWRVYGRNRPIAQRAVYLGMIFGQFGPQPLLTKVMKWKPGEYTNPEDMFEHMVEYGLKEDDAWYWAEKMGIKEAVT